MAAINKSFVIKNGLEVSTDLIFVDAPKNKVGIGTTNPLQKLQIGNVDVSGISTDGKVFVVTSDAKVGIGTTNPLEKFQVGSGSSSFFVTTVGSVGLGITNPQYKLQVIGGIGVTDSFVTGVSTVLTTLRVGTGGTVLTVLGAGNSIGVGTASPQYLFHINSPVSTGQTALYVQGDVRITGDLSVDDITFDEASLTNLYVSGIGTIVNGTITNLTGTSGTITTFNSTNSTITNLNVTGIGTIATLNATGIGVTNFTVYNALSVGGISTFTNGPVLIGSGTSTGTASQRLQVTGGTYVSGNLGIGSTNPTSKLDVIGDVRVTGVITATTFSGNVSAGVGTITTLSSTNGTITNLTGTAATIGTVKIVSGIITATSGIVTYYGDGTYLTGTASSPNLQAVLNTGNTSNIGFSITGVSTLTTLNSTSGTITNISGTAGTITTLNSTSGTITNISGTAGTITTLNSTNGTITNISGINLNYSGIGTITNLRGVNINVTGVITATSFVGDGSGLTGAGSTVFNDTTTNQEFFPLFTATTSGTITASGISTSKLTYNPSTGTVTAVDFNSTSDINLKENIHTVGNALEITEQLRGVSFDWKETGRSSYGVIAQELEEILPELVTQGDVKSVNYNGIIGVLIEAIKKLKKEIEDLKVAK